MDAGRSRSSSASSIDSLEQAVIDAFLEDARSPGQVANAEPTSDPSPIEDAESTPAAEPVADTEPTSAPLPIEDAPSNPNEEPIVNAESTSAPLPTLSNDAASVPLPPSPVSPSPVFTFNFINPKAFPSPRTEAGSSHETRALPTPGLPSPGFQTLLARAFGPAIEAEEAGSVRRVRMPRSRRLGASVPAPVPSTSHQLSPDTPTFSALTEEQLRHQIITLMRERDEAIAARDQEVTNAERSKQQQSSFLAAAQANGTRIEKQYQKLSREEKDHLDRIETQESTIQRLQNDLDAANQMVSHEKVKSGVSGTALNNRNQQLKKAEDEIEVLRKFNTSLQTQFDNLKDQEKKLRNRVTGLEKQCKDSKAKLQDYPTQIATLKRERDEHKADRNVAEAKLCDLSLECQNLTEERAKAEGEIERLQGEMFDFARDQSQAHYRARELEESNDRLKSQNATLRQDLEAAQKQLADQKTIKAQEPERPKTPMDPPPQFPPGGDDDDDDYDEWVRKMTKLTGGSKIPDFEEEAEEVDGGEVEGEKVVEEEAEEKEEERKVVGVKQQAALPSPPENLFLWAGVFLVFFAMFLYGWACQRQKMFWIAANAATKRAW